MAKIDVVDYGVRHAFQRVRVRSKVGDHSLAKQAFRDECDINNIMKRFERDGVLAHYNTYQGDYGDFTDCPEYHDAQNKVLAANEMFLTLPGAIRERFGNDPGRFLGFVADPKNVDEMIALGLAKKREEVVPDKGKDK